MLNDGHEPIPSQVAPPVCVDSKQLWGGPQEVVLPGYTQAPVGEQPMAPQKTSVVEHGPVQQ